MTITAHSPKWVNTEHSAINLIVQFPWLTEEVPFTATLNDTDYATELFNAALGGDFGVIEEFVAPVLPVFIPNVTPRQIRQALTRLGLRQAVEDAVAVGSQDLKDWWEFSISYDRNNELVIAMGTALGVTPEQMDDLWLLAATL